MIYSGTVSHQRLGPIDHRFGFGLTFVAVDLDDLGRLDREVRGFGYNRARPAAVRDGDFVVPGPGSIRQKIEAKMAAHGVRQLPKRIRLVTVPRHFGYVFNPVSFYLGYDDDDSLSVLVAEVNNTFGDRHLYVMPITGGGKADRPATVHHDKEFHVSPFYAMQGKYRFRVETSGAHLAIEIQTIKEQSRVFRAVLTGQGVPLTTRTLARALLRHPLRPWMTMPRILAQAAILHYRHRLPLFRRPEPTNPRTVVRRRPPLSARLAMRAVVPALARMKFGRLRIVLPDGSEIRCGDDILGPTETLQVRDYRFFTRLAWSGAVGLGEAFVDGDVTCEDITRVLELFVRNLEHVAGDTSFLSRLGRLRNRFVHLLRPNSRRISRKNIRDHYDLSNDFFETFLDPSMTYSSAVFRSPSDTLEQAQRTKLGMLIRKARIEAGQHVLEIGSGWGSFAIEAARTTGCRVTSITLSEEQYALATQRVREAGLDDLVEIRLCDYRDVRGAFDRIVSVEMLEAVGHRYYRPFFAQCERLLKPDGLVVLQVITIPDERYAAYRRGCDWIQKHVFPGGHLPSLSALSTAMTRGSRLYVEHLENIGPHYARTLRRWRETFMENADAVEALGFDPSFRRKWEYYLSYCEAGFATRALNTLQIVLSRAGNRQLLRDDERGGAMGAKAVETSPSTVDASEQFADWR